MASNNPQFNLRMSEDLRDWIKKKADAEDRSMNWIILRELNKAKALDMATGVAA